MLDLFPTDNAPPLSDFFADGGELHVVENIRGSLAGALYVPRGKGIDE